MRLTKRKSALSVLVLSVTYVGSLVLLGWSVAAVWREFDDLGRAVDAELRLEVAKTEVLRLNELVRTSAKTAVATGDRRWRESHAQDARRLKAALRQASELVSHSNQSVSIDAAEGANDMLLGLEDKAMRLAVKGKNAHATAVLASADFLKWDAIFDTRLLKFMQNGQKALHLALTGMRSELGALVAAVASLVAVLLSIFALVFYVMTKQALALASSGARLTKANIELETRVRERTADLETQRQRFRDFAETTSDWFWETNDKLEIESVSDNFAAATGIAKENFLGLSLLQLEPSDQHGHVTDEWRPKLTRRSDVRGMYVMIQSPTRGRVYLRFAGRAVRNDTGDFIGYRGTSADITQALARARAIYQGQKLQALGTMAAGLAHEFNNILSIVMGYAESLRNAMRGDEEAVVQLDQIVEAGRRGTSLSKSLLSFGRSSKSRTREIFNSRALAVELPQLVKPLLGPGYSLVIEAANQPLWVNGDRDLLLQCIVNLVVNARDAMPKGGPITLSLDVEPAGGPRLARAGLPAGRDFVAIRVSDTGLGMDQETVRRIFDPFFTTKKVGQGTGLGLSLLFSFVKEHEGHVEVVSEPNLGTAFVILLPLSAPPAARAISSADPAASDFTGLRVLLIDDEPQLVVIYEKMLRGLGFDVVSFSDANAALGLIDDERQKIDLVVSDVLMPQMSGFRFAELASALRRIEVLFVTGQPERGQGDADPAPKNAKILRKPFDRNQLSHAIGELLGAKAAA